MCAGSIFLGGEHQNGPSARVALSVWHAGKVTVVASVAVPSNAESALVDRLRRAHVVLDYIVVRTSASGSDEERHRAALVIGLAEASLARGAEEPETEELPGREVSVDEFFGERFDRTSGRLLMKPSVEVLREKQRRNLPFPPGHFGPYTWSDADDADHLVWLPHDTPRGWGYAAAFSDPPRPVRLRHADVQRTFADANEVLLGGPDDGSRIWQWDGQRSRSAYFWPGQDLSGATAWTVERADEQIVFIGCSADENTPFGFEPPPGMTTQQFMAEVTRRLEAGDFEA